MRALWSDRQNCSHNVSQKFKRIRRFSEIEKIGKILVSVQLSARNSGARDDCANFMGAWRMRSFCRKNHAHEFLALGGGIWGLGGEGSADFIFMGARIFFD